MMQEKDRDRERESGMLQRERARGRSDERNKTDWREFVKVCELQEGEEDEEELGLSFQAPVNFCILCECLHLNSDPFSS